MIDLSIIIPVYNGEKHIEKCLNSLLPQIQSNVEVIVVNDGSSDNTLKILMNYRNIKIYNNVNQGPGLSRNFGIKVSKGKYIAFVDSDDYLSSDYVKLIIQKIKLSPDVIFLDLMQLDEEGRLLSHEKISRYSKLSRVKLVKYHLTSKIPWGGVRKVVKKSVLSNNNIFFSSGIVGEEAAYTLKLLLFANRFEFINKTIYYYINHPNSQSKKGGLNPYLPLINQYKEILYELDSNRTYYKTLNSFRYVALCVSLKRQSLNTSFSEAVKDYKKTIINNEYNFKGMEFNSLKIKYILMYIPIRLRLYRLIYLMLKETK